MICKADSSLLPSWEAYKESGCVVDYCKQVMDIARQESCGQCVFCREGTWQTYEIMKEITEGYPESDDYELLLDILEQIEKGSSCEMARESAARCTRLMKEYEEDWDKHIRRKRCNNMICKCSYTLYIDPQLCDGCGICREHSLAGVIAGAPGMIHVISADDFKNHSVSISICPQAAIKKAGSVKPKIPTEPVPVGSFSAEADDDGGDGLRRRRRRG